MAMRHLCLDSVLVGKKEEVPVVDRMIYRDRLHAHYGTSKVAKHFAVLSLIPRQILINESFPVRSHQWLVGTGSLIFIVQKPKERSYS